MSDRKFFDQLLAIADLLRADEERTLPSLGLSAARAHVLWVLQHEGPTKQIDIAARMGVTPRHVTTLVDELVAGGLVRRSPHPHDRRAVLVTPTETGTSVMEVMARTHRDTERRLSDAIPADRRDALHDDLERLRQRLLELTREDAG